VTMPAVDSLFRRRAGVWLAALLAGAASAPAQQDPQVGYVYPAGVRQGTESEVAVGGQYLDGVSGALISGTGIEVMLTGYEKPTSRRQLAAARRRRRELRERLAAEAMQQAKKPSAEASSLLNVFVKEREGLDLDALAEEDRRRASAKSQPNPQIAEIVTLYLTVARDAACGVRELRLKTSSGLSNPLLFHVSPWREYREAEPNDKVADAGVPDSRPVVINGQIMPGDVDRFRFRAAQGTRLVAAVSAQSLIPYLADAVPGWFQATLKLSDAQGNQLAYADDFRFHPDPVIYYEVPRSGQYVLEIKDAIFRGREDFVYRIALGEVPFATGVFPLGGRAGATTAVRLRGWNLLSAALTLNAQGRGPGLLPVAACEGERLAKALPFALDTLPECLEKEPNDDRRSAQPVACPRIVNGHIDPAGDWDVFRLSARAGQWIVAEVQARRLGSPVDSLLKLTDADGKLLAANDDHEDKAAGLTTHHADSRLRVRLPKDGTYLLHLGDTQRKGGPAYAYRLRIAPPQPDFELRVVPSGLNAQPGATVPITVHALRRDGFSDDIALRLKGAAPGFVLGGAWVPAGRDKARLTLTVPRRPAARPVRLHLEGRAVIEGREVVRAAVPAEDMMQAFVYRHLVPTKDWVVSITGRRRQGASLKLLGRGPVRLPAGGTGRLRLSVPKALAATQLRVELNEPPEGIAVKKVSPDRAGLTVLLSLEEGKAKPGLKGNLIAEAFREWALKSRDGKPTGRTRRISLGILPAIPFEVVAGAGAKSATP